jgi:hypothetical protein
VLVQTAATACSAAANGHCRSVRISSDQHRRCRRNCVAIEACLPYQRRRPSGPCENQTGGGRRRGQRLTSRRRHPLCSTQLAVPETAPFLLLYPTPGVAGSHPRRIAAESWGPAVAPTVAVLWARPPARPCARFIIRKAAARTRLLCFCPFVPTRARARANPPTRPSSCSLQEELRRRPPPRPRPAPVLPVGLSPGEWVLLLSRGELDSISQRGALGRMGNPSLCPLHSVLAIVVEQEEIPALCMGSDVPR